MTGALQAMVRNARKFAVTLSGLLASGTSSGTPVTSSTITGTPVNGTAPFTYAWTITNDGGVGIVAVSPTSASTAFRADLVAGDLRFGAAFLTVTDSLGHVAVSQSVDIKLKRTGLAV